MAGEQCYEVMTDAWGWGDPHQFVRGDVVTKADADPYDIEWAEKMGTVRRMSNAEVRGLEAREDDNGFNPCLNPVTGLLSTVRSFEEEAEMRDASGVLSDEFTEGQAAAIPSGGGTAVDQVKLENQQAGNTGAAAKESTSKPAGSTASASDKDK